MHQKYGLLCWLIAHPGWHSREELIRELELKEGSVSTFMTELRQSGLAECAQTSSRKAVYRALSVLLTPEQLKAQGEPQLLP